MSEESSDTLKSLKRIRELSASVENMKEKIGIAKGIMMCIEHLASRDARGANELRVLLTKVTGEHHD